MDLRGFNLVSCSLFFSSVLPLSSLLLCAGWVDAQVVNTIYSFDGATGQNPQFASLTQGRDGTLYGTTVYGGATGQGTVFSLRPNGTENVLHSFAGSDGVHPFGALTLATDGNLYGVAAGGGLYSLGVLFKMSPGGVFTVLHNFGDGADGVGPITGPIEATDGNFYGLTFGDFSSVYPTVYRYTPQGILTTIYTFPDLIAVPEAPLLQTADGSLYTVTEHGGAFDCGEILKLTTVGVLKWAHSFSCFKEGNSPIGALIQGVDGNIYGTTAGGGTFEEGAIFELNRSRAVTFLYNFGEISGDGSFPYAGLTQGTDGNFYGATTSGGSAGAGSLYELELGGAYSQLYSFPVPQGAQSQDPMAAVVQHTNGKFYGVTFTGGNLALGSVYSLNMDLGPFITFVRPFGKVGASAQVLGQRLTGTTGVTFNGVPAASFKVVSDTYMTAVVPSGATTGLVVVTTPSGTLTSNKNFLVRPN